LTKKTFYAYPATCQNCYMLKVPTIGTSRYLYTTHLSLICGNEVFEQREGYLPVHVPRTYRDT